MSAKTIKEVAKEVTRLIKEHNEGTSLPKLTFKEILKLLGPFSKTYGVAKRVEKSLVNEAGAPYEIGYIEISSGADIARIPVNDEQDKEVLLEFGADYSGVPDENVAGNNATIPETFLHRLTQEDVDAYPEFRASGKQAGEKVTLAPDHALVTALKEKATEATKASSEQTIEATATIPVVATAAAAQEVDAGDADAGEKDLSVSEAIEGVKTERNKKKK